MEAESHLIQDKGIGVVSEGSNIQPLLDKRGDLFTAANLALGRYRDHRRLEEELRDPLPQRKGVRPEPHRSRRHHKKRLDQPVPWVITGVYPSAHYGSNAQRLSSKR